jgi:uncharacterized membrane protein YfcA
VAEPALPVLVALAAAAALVLGLLKTSVGGGIGLTLTPLLTLILPPSAVLGLLGCLMVLSDPISLRMYWRRWEAGLLRRLIPSSLVGIVLGAWLLAGLSEAGLRRLIGAAALLMAGLTLVGLLRAPRAHPHDSPVVSAGVGVTMGVASVVANSGGIILGPYLAGLGLSNAAVVGTGQAVVTVANVLKLAAYWAIGFVTLKLVLLAVLTTPLVYLGSLVGYRLNARLPRRALALTLIAIAIAGGAKLLLG